MPPFPVAKAAIVPKSPHTLIFPKGARLESQPEEARGCETVRAKRRGVRREILIGRVFNDAIVRYVA